MSLDDIVEKKNHISLVKSINSLTFVAIIRNRKPKKKMKTEKQISIAAAEFAERWKGR